MKNYFYLFSDSRTDTVLEGRFPIVPQEPVDFFIDQIALRAQPKEKCTIDLSVDISDDKGITANSPYAVVIGKQGEKLFRFEKRTDAGHSAEIVVRCRGDLVLESCFVRYKEKKWRKRAT